MPTMLSGNRIGLMKTTAALASTTYDIKVEKKVYLAVHPFIWLLMCWLYYQLRVTMEGGVELPSLPKGFWKRKSMFIRRKLGFRKHGDP
jgi:hypothetical protein